MSLGSRTPYVADSLSYQQYKAEHRQVIATARLDLTSFKYVRVNSTNFHFCTGPASTVFDFLLSHVALGIN